MVLGFHVWSGGHLQDKTCYIKWYGEEMIARWEGFPIITYSQVKTWSENNHVMAIHIFLHNFYYDTNKIVNYKNIKTNHCTKKSNHYYEEESCLLECAAMV
jgi:hypothetical protein